MPVLLLSLRPIASIAVDLLIAMPVGGLAGIIANSALKGVLDHRPDGLAAGTAIRCADVAGHRLNHRRYCAVVEAYLSIMLLELGVSRMDGMEIIHADATMLDHLPHGSFFHAIGGSVNMAVHERLKLLPYETLVGSLLSRRFRS